MNTTDRPNEIAIVGLSCRFPGASDAAEYWSNLCAAVESIATLSDEELAASGVAPELLRDPRYVRAFGALPDAYAFDAAFFRVSQNEARVMDPQQRVFLECAWSALEDAGCDPGRFAGAIGVFGGSGLNGHYARILAHPDLVSAVGDEVALAANNRDFLTTLVSYKLGLRGPSVVIQTACSTSLVAIHFAAQSLLSRECDLALAGAVSIAVDQGKGYRYEEGGIRSPDGHCRAFDAAAAGTVKASGVGIVVLKRMADALRDGDTIRAVLKGSAVNNDGSEKIGFAAPSVKGQASVIAEALAVAGLEPSAISYIEAHGTATPLGDPIEVAALRDAFAGVPRGTVALGAVKTNIGHVDAAAGVAGFIKTVLALEHGVLPPSLHFETPNPETRLDTSPFYVNTTLRPWETNGSPRRAGVSSFGIGGTNAHAVLEEAPALPAPPPCEAAQLITLSAQTEAALGRMRENLGRYLAELPELSVADLASTLQEGRAAHPHRWAVAAADFDDVKRALDGSGERQPVSRRADLVPPVSFLFPGQGSQYPGMVRTLYLREPVFRTEIDRCADVLAAGCGLDLRSLLAPADGAEEESGLRLRQTHYVQPALFAVEYALARLWMAWGVEPDAMLGHSLGEYVAACLADVFPLESALRLIEARGRLIQGVAPGAMLAVRLAEDDISRQLPPELSLAAVNGAAECVVSGASHDIDRFAELLTKRQIIARRLETSHAFHSAAMDSILEAFAAEVRAARPNTPRRPFLSNVTGDWIAAADAADPGYWVRHLRETVRFGAGIRKLLEHPQRVLLEVGPGNTLAALARREAGVGAGRVVVNSLPAARQAGKSGVAILEAIGALWTAGVPVDWPAIRGERAWRRIPLPTYPFERTEYRVPRPPAVSSQTPPVDHAGRDPESAPDKGSRMRAADEATRSSERPRRSAARLIGLFARLLGTAAADLDVSRTFLEQGADSMLLMQASRSIENELGVRVPFRQLVDGLATIEQLAEHVDATLPPETGVVHAAAAPASQDISPDAGQIALHPDRSLVAPGAAVREVVTHQLLIMQQQIELLRAGMGRTAVVGEQRTVALDDTRSDTQNRAPAATGPHGPYRPIARTMAEGGKLTERQAQYLDDFVNRYTARTRRSKDYASEHRPVLADNRAALGFRMATKELVYPLVGERSSGSRLWDVDGNEYIDFTMGFGVHLFGHRASFIVEAVEEQLRRGFHLGPQSNLAGTAARLVTELTGMERATFCNTGSEAVMTALRIARAATGRDRIVIFDGSYHGTFDGVLARAAAAPEAEPVSRPVAPGTPQRMVDDVVVLPYATPETMAWLSANASGLAAVVVEPVQSRRLEFHPRDFLRQVRDLTQGSGTVLIFDEMITGFRLSARGGQGYYDIDADLATYGKVIGGGFPIGVVAGRSRLMDAIDGGMWSYGDDSYPAAGQTFFAGTFCKHPVVMAAACAVLRHIQQQGPSLYDELNARTDRLVAALRHVIAEEEAPVRVEACGSRFTFRLDDHAPFANLLFHHLLQQGMYIWEGRGCFLSTAHTDEDGDRLVTAFRASVAALREGGFLPERSGSSRQPRLSVETPDLPRSFPLTPAQRQVWVHAQLGPDASRAYHEQIVFGLRGPLNAVAMQAAIDDVVRHHEGLRTVFDPSGERQHVLPFVPIVLRVTTSVSESDEDLEADARARREAAREIFDLANGPLVRVQVYTRGPDRHVLQIVYHHLAMDAQAAAIVLRDLEAAYRARRDAQVQRLPAALQLSRYAGLLADRTAAHSHREAEWLRRFEGAQPLALPLDRSRPALSMGAAAQARSTIGAALMAQLRDFGRREGCTLFMTLCSGLLALIHRLTDQDDVLIGVPSSGRPFPGAESVVAHCVSVLPIRSRAKGTALLLPFVKAVRALLLDAYDSDVFSSAHLTEKVAFSRGPGAPPLVSVTFNLEPGSALAERGTATFAGLPRHDVHGRELFAAFDAQIDAVERDNHIELLCRYNAELFDRDTMARLLDRWVRVLEQIVSSPDVPLAQLDLLSETERRLVRVDWNRTAVEPGAEARVHRLFEAQADQFPDAPAVACDGQRLTYRELNAGADALARVLRDHAVDPDVPVGLFLDRSLDLPIALLGILKAGGAYVPLDPAYPAARRQLMIEDAGLSIVVTTRRLAGELPLTSRPVFIEDVRSTSGDRAPVTAIDLEPDHLAYVIYTSGSTGVPKGVGVTHRNLSNLLASIAREPGFTAEDTLLAVTTLSFDVGTAELLVPLVTGGQVVIATRETATDGARLRALMEECRPTFMHPTPVTWRLLLEAGWTGAPQLTIGSTGEALTRQLAERLIDKGKRLWNLYGPTETTIWSTVHAVTSGTGLVPIGRPIANTDVYVLDAHGQPVPIGVWGELYLGGAGVARGYLGRPAATAERFAPNPFVMEAGARLYRTGDRARWRGDAVLEFRGRIDRQIKIRGVRVEPAEVESTLRRHPAVRDCAVAAREDAPGEPRLVAYVVSDASADTLRAHLRHTLPDALIPSAFVALAALPISSNGKVDYTTLPPPPSAAEPERFVSPRTAVEEVLAGIWADLLRAERVGVNDDFFALGGHSLLAMRAVGRIRDVFGVELPMQVFFETATVAAVAEAIQAARRVRRPEPTAIAPVARTTPPPLSFAQERLWFLDRLKPGSSAYNLTAVRRLSGILHVPALERALREIVRRHVVLRTTIAEVDGAPVQMIAPFDGSTLPVEDLSRLGEGAREDETQRWVRALSAQPFDLATGPLLRVVLLRLGSDAHVLIVSMHHVLSDAWSMDVLFREMSVLYGSYRDGRDSPLPDLAVQYADYAVWQRAQLPGDVLLQERAYWRDRLTGAPELMALPTDHPRPPTQSDRGAREVVELPLTAHERLQELARREGATIYMVLLGAFQVLLSRYTASDDVVVGSPIAGRTRKQLEPLIGFFVNTLVLRTSTSGDPPFREMLRRVRETTLGAYQHQELPFEQLVAELQPQRSMTHSPLFQVMFSLHQTEGDGTEWPGLVAERVATPDSGTTKFDLILEAFIDRSRTGAHGTSPSSPLRLSLTYRPELFERCTIARMLRHLTRVLEQIGDDPDRRLSELELLDAAERLRVLHEWNATAVSYPESCLHELFEAQAVRTPNAVAIVWDGQRLSYARLNAAANRLAHHLRGCGVGPDVRVGICLERSVEMVVGLLAILKAGGAYVPLDPAYPPERIGAMLRDSTPVAVLTHGATRGLFGGMDVPTIDFDADARAWSAQLDTNPPRDALTPDHLCYVIYTSGSTGHPKGVMNQHRCVVNRLVWGQRAWQLIADDAILGHTSLTFDGSLRELFWPLSVGARVVLAGRDGARDPDTLLAIMRREAVTTINLVPSVLQLLLEHPSAGSCSALRRILCGGDVLPSALFQRARERWPQADFHHMYGPSEAATAMTFVRCEPAQSRDTVPIGRPTGNVRVYLLDAASRPVPVGMLGELFIGGVGVSRGYLRRPALTAERFVPDSFAEMPGSRLYRTGDLARWLPDGTLEFCGRSDFQVKVRGFRVEPSEIEAVLRRLPNLTNCVVVPRENGTQDRRLVAYYAADGGLDVRGVRAFASQHLPEYMVPSAFVRLDALPLTQTGKVDRKALPPPGRDAYVTHTHEDPQDDVEAALAEIWADVLGVERVGRRDHFFEMGGHSLRAVQVTSRVRQVLAADVALRELFLHPVLADFARRVATATRVELPPIGPAPASERQALSFAQRRLWFVEHMGDTGSAYHIPRRLRLRGSLDRTALARAMARIVVRHESLRTTFVQVGGEPIQQIAPPRESDFVLREHDLRGHPDAEAELNRVVRDQAEALFDLGRGPLVRGCLVRLGDDDHVLLITLHHIVADGWSMGILLDELGALYAAFIRGETDPLPPLAVQYADWAAWQRRCLGGDVLAEHAAYWQSALCGAPPVLALPTDRPRPVQQDFAGSGVPVLFDEALTAGLTALSRRHSTTLFMTVLAGWAIVLGRLASHADVVIGTPMANRMHEAIERLIGFFINTLPVRVDLSGGATLGELLARVKAQVLDAQQHQDMPFEELVELIRPPRSLAHSPVFQVVFAWQNTPRRRLELPGLACAAFDASDHAAKYDLSLTLQERDGHIEGEVAFATALFEPGTVERHVEYLRRILTLMVAADEGQRIDELQLLDAAERAFVVEACNQTARPYPRQCVHELFEARVAAAPGAEAVVRERESLTYAELNARANQLARRLRRAGVGPDDLVAVCLDRSPDLLVTLLAVLKAGGAYVPLDPEYPAERLAFMLSDTAASVLVTERALRDRLPSSGAHVVCLDEEQAALMGESTEDLETVTGLDHLAYVMYTSGSTGLPKGVSIPHRGIVRLVFGTDYARFGSEERLLQLAPVAFDASTFEVWGALLHGGGCVISPQRVPTATELGRILHEHRVTTLWLTASLFNAVIDEAPDALRGVRQLLIGGEALSVPHVRRALASLPDTTIINGYGPTESTTFTCCETIPRDLDERVASVPIGRPIGNTTVYVLDGSLRPQPVGVAGELYIGGDGVARAYHGRRALTAEKFLPDPFARAAGGRMYRTGDLVRWLFDGRLEFLKRADDQLKIRGFRIEPAEVETVLKRHAEVREAVVIPRAHDGREPRLVAYVVGDVRTEELRTHVQQSLPDYMVPAEFVSLARLPLTPAGKLDVAALPPPIDGEVPGRDVALRTPVEEELAHIWADVLHVDRVGATDSFLDLGGHSLAIMRLAARIRTAFGLDLSFRALFSASTLVQMAAEIERLIHDDILTISEEEAQRLAALDDRVSR
jgi:amino acid adenylation domain-containing protein